MENLPEQRFPVKLLPYFISGILIFGLGLAGQWFSFSTLGISLILASICLAWGFWSQPRFVPLLADVWIVAYLYLFVSEFVLSRKSDLLLFGEFITNLTEGFIVSAFGASLIGYGILMRFFQSRQLRNASLDGVNNKISSRMYRATVKISGRKSQATSTVDVTRKPIPVSISVFLVLLLLSIFYYLGLMRLEQLLYVGRAYRSVNVIIGYSSLLQAITVVFPTLVVFLLIKYKVPFPLKVALFVGFGVSLFLVFTSGTRYLVGYQWSGVMFLQIFRSKSSTKQGLVFIFLILLLLVGSSIIFSSRGMGLGNVAATGGLTIDQLERYLSPEGILHVNALIHFARAYPFGDRVPENLFILYWWVPRAWWPNKPVMAGYWVIRELSSERGFSSGHSVSGGFAMPALLDFGPVTGAFFCIFYGILIGYLELFVWRERNDQRPTLILAALLYFGVFFMMRSLHTSLMSLMLLALVSVVPLTLLTRFSTAKLNRCLFSPSDTLSAAQKRLHTQRGEE